MAQGTDLFNSTKGQYGEYTTLIGGVAPDTSYWFLENFESDYDVSAIEGAFTIHENGLGISGAASASYSFRQSQKNNLKDCAIIVEYLTGATTLGSTIGVFSRETGGDFIYGLVDNDSAEIKIIQRVSSSDTEINSAEGTALNPNTTYWLVFLTVGDFVRMELWSTDPREGGSPIASLNEDIPSGFDVASKIGITNWIPADSDARIVSIETGYAFASQTERITTVLEKQHVDIRDFINYRYPIRFRTIGELNEFNITEKAFSQTITLDAVVTDGTFDLYFYPSDADPYVPIAIGPFAFDAADEDIKNVLNNALNALPKFSVTDEDPIKNVVSKIGESEMTLMIEFNEDFGEISLLRMGLSDLTPPVISQESYESTTGIGTFYPTEFDSQKYIETADPLNKQLTLDDLRIEYKLKNENWTLYRGADASLAPQVSYFRDGDLKVGKIPSEGNQRGAQLEFARAMKSAEKTVAGSWSVFLQSFSKSVNCKTIGPSSGSHISIVFADYPWKTGTNESVLDIGPSGCYVQFTSHPLGLFSDQGGSADVDSEKVYFEDNIYYEAGSPNSGDVEFLCPMTDFENASDFDFSRVTGVRLLLKSAVISVESSIKIMAIRAIPNARVSSSEWIKAEINTLEQNISYPILGYQQETAELAPMIAGAQLETIASDPSPIDSRQALIFQTGVGGGNLNKMMLFSREQEFDDYLRRSSWLTAEYAFSSAPDSYLKRYKTLRVESGIGFYWDIHPGGVFEDDYSSANIGVSYLPALVSESNYEIAGVFQGNSIGFQIQELTSAEQPQRVIYDAPYVSSAEWSTAAGRIGWYVEFADKDMSISAFDLESAAFAVLRTKQFISETPIEGAQLFAVDSGEKNLFERFFPLSTSDRVYIDNQKTAGGLGSFAFQSYGGTQRPGVISNQFTVNDWNHIYIEFDVWVPRDLRTPEKRPKFALRPVEQPEGTSGADVFSGIVPANAPIAFDFIAGAWSRVAFDLRGTNAKNGDYYLVIFSDGDGSSEASTFRNTWWIDNVKINTQTIEWELRAIENGSWTPFRKNVNRQYGALHLSENQIGKNIQLQAKALTEDAWIAEYTLIPKYLSPGRILDSNRYILEEQQ